MSAESKRLGVIAIALRHALIALAIITSTAMRAGAQTVGTFSDLPLVLGPGDKIMVVGSDGTRIRGRILKLTPSEIVLAGDPAPATLTSERVRQIGRCSDSLKNGALIGGVAGALGFVSGLTFAGRVEVGDGLFLGAIFGGLGAGVGAGIDALIAHDVVIYRAQPMLLGFRVDLRRQAALVTVGF